MASKIKKSYWQTKTFQFYNKVCKVLESDVLFSSSVFFQKFMELFPKKKHNFKSENKEERKQQTSKVINTENRMFAFLMNILPIFGVSNGLGNWEGLLRLKNVTVCNKMFQLLEKDVLFPSSVFFKHVTTMFAKEET